MGLSWGGLGSLARAAGVVGRDVMVRARCVRGQQDATDRLGGKLNSDTPGLFVVNNDIICCKSQLVAASAEGLWPVRATAYYLVMVAVLSHVSGTHLLT